MYSVKSSEFSNQPLWAVSFGLSVGEEIFLNTLFVICINFEFLFMYDFFLKIWFLGFKGVFKYSVLLFLMFRWWIGGGFFLESDFEKAQVVDVEIELEKVQALSWKIVLMACFKVKFWSCCDPFAFWVCLLLWTENYDNWRWFCDLLWRILIICACLNVVFAVMIEEQQLCLTFSLNK